MYVRAGLCAKQTQDTGTMTLYAYVWKSLKVSGNLISLRHSRLHYYGLLNSWPSMGRSQGCLLRTETRKPLEACMGGCGATAHLDSSSGPLLSTMAQRFTSWISSTEDRIQCLASVKRYAMFRRMKMLPGRNGNASIDNDQVAVL